MHWNLDPTIHYLNHGAFGSCPSEIIEEFRQWQDRLEQSPLRFVLREIDEKLAESRRVLANFVGADAAGMALVANATHGVNTVLKSLAFKNNDEVVITNHIYPACRNALKYIQSQSGLKIREVIFPLEGITPEIIRQKVLEAITPATRLVMLDHITSPTALIFPVDEIVEELNRLGIESLIDGAHAPGSIPLNIKNINPTYYTGNCHKWMCLPKSCGFLWVRDDAREKMVPLAISHAWGDTSTFEQRFHWQGTTDWSAALCLPYSIGLIGKELPGGWTEWMERNHRLVVQSRNLLCRTLNIDPPCPEEMLGSIAAFPLTGKPRPLRLGYNSIDQLQESLYRQFLIEVPIFQWPDENHLVMRISAQQYNRPEEYQLLADALKQLLAL